ncbi:MAG: phosphopyruvate hydratase [Candidatus Pacebacteria bacterium]|nr:phosphopyruvate hydratase [Candidatus Paceibacterota bacterium]PIR60584.1 MAG: phosphopyruvate hydratase [Candidatus Pacebacteria bacterium CG10_big_fil_rev_8_21_14_0_10_44_54]
MHISSLNAYEIIASGGYPTLEVTLELSDGSAGVASVPYGASAGSYEATVLVDGDSNRYNGNGMLTAIAHIDQVLAPVLTKQSFVSQAALDNALIGIDGTVNKKKLGGNTILAISLAYAKAVAQSRKQPLYLYILEEFKLPTVRSLPKPMMVTVEGGKHADNSTDLQEFCLSAIGSKPIREHVRATLEAYHLVKKILQKNGLSTNVGNEGAFAPGGITSNEQPLQFLVNAIEQAGYEPGKDLGISIDPAASEYYQDNMYHLKLEKTNFDAKQMIDYYRDWLKKYPFVSIEDPLAEDDWDHWPIMQALCAEHNVPLIGDDLTVTSVKRLQKAIDLKAVSGVLVKLNQIGSLTETIQCCQLAQKHKLMIVPSHRGGGESNDTSMVDVAVAVGAAYIKVGPTRGERVAKYNRLLEIERQASA